MKANDICIIGAGPSGLAAAKYLVAENAFSRIVIFEQRSTVGGLWNYLWCPAGNHEAVSVPQTTPLTGLEAPIVGVQEANETHSGDCEGDVKFMSPIYDRLETNIPRELMGFSDLAWPEDCQLFPKHQDVLTYLERYAEQLRPLIRFRRQVTDVRACDDGRWRVTTRSGQSTSNFDVETDSFDAVIVANGHFNVPFVPSVPGMKEWSRRYPGSIVHSKTYRNPDELAGQKVVVVGNSASGIDIGAQIASVCQTPLIVSQKSASYLQPDPSPGRLEKPEIIEYMGERKAIRFADGSVETDIDVVVYCTGYFYSYPFLQGLNPPVVTTGEHVDHVYQHIFYQSKPTLAFLTLNQKIIPFPLAEAQSAVIARVFSGRLRLPSEKEMTAWERETIAVTGGGRDFHVLKFPKDADYINMLHDWALRAGDGKGDKHFGTVGRRLSRDGVLNPTDMSTSLGKEPPFWGEKEYWMRERFPAIKKAFQGFGEGRHVKRTLEDVGFSFDEWKRERIEESKRAL